MKMKVFGILLALLMLCGVSAFAAEHAPLEVHFIDVNIADCALLINGDHAMLIDAGNLYRAGLVLDYLKEHNIEKLDAIFISHPHNDHMGGFLGIVGQIPIEKCYMGANFEGYRSDAYDKLTALRKEANLEMTYLESEDTFPFGDLEMTVYCWMERKATENDHSMIVHAKFGNRAFLFGADIENRAQFALGLEFGERLKADVLKVPHHGQNRVMQEMHDAVQPQYAIITNGDWPESVKSQIRLMERRGVLWYCTTNGTIVFKTDGEDLSVEQLEKAYKYFTE
jgi:Predicted hydrolase (metallo-beta-lactamase superfamily)